MNKETGGTTDLEVDVDITRWDIGCLSWHMVVRSKVVWFIGILLSLAILWSALMQGDRQWEMLKTVVFILVVGFVLILYVILWAALAALMAMLTAGRGAGVLGSHLYRITEEGLRETTAANESPIRWQGIMATKEIGGYLVAFQTPVLAHAFPRRCFADGGDYAIFAAALREKVRGAHGKPR